MNQPHAPAAPPTRPLYPATVQEQRRAIRRRLPAQVTMEYVRLCREMHETAPPRRFWVTARDISTRGIGFQHRQMMYYGERVRVELRLPGGAVQYVTAVVVRCRRLGPERFEIGAAFQQADGPPAPEPIDAPPDAADA